jgi:putative SOS response-associated peptidase YedK
MCGRFTLEATAAFYAWFHLENRLDALVPRYNIAPGQLVPVVIAKSPRQVVLMRWGLIPHWAKDAQMGYKMINARVETLTQKPAFRGLLSRNRCLVPASGFYEWKAEGRGKTPYYIHPQGEPFVAFAGLYDVWTHPTGEAIHTFTIITTDADDFMARLHHRMPVILARELEDAWLDMELTNAPQVLDLLSRNTGLQLDAYPVSRMVNRPSIDEKALIAPMA